MKLKSVLLLFVAMSLLVTSAAWADTDSKNINISATVAARAKLTLGSATMTFPDADPDTGGGSISPNEGVISVSSKVRSNSTCDLTVLTPDLVSGSNTIAISNITWTATGAGYVGGAMNKTTAQTVGSWAAAASGTHDGNLTFALANSWSYAPGTYTATAAFTLTAP